MVAPSVSLFFCEFVPRYEEVMVEIRPTLDRLPSTKPLILVSEYREAKVDPSIVRLFVSKCQSSFDPLVVLLKYYYIQTTQKSQAIWPLFSMKLHDVESTGGRQC